MGHLYFSLNLANKKKRLDIRHSLCYNKIIKGDDLNHQKGSMNMKTYTFTTNAGYSISVKAPDHDRARCAAKKAAGNNWHPSARITAITNVL